MSRITVSTLQENLKQFEAVERKGIGHPDTLADAVAERLSNLYCRWMKENFDGYAHHWFDKVMLIGGHAAIDYGSAKLTRPYKMIVAGKAVLTVEDQEVPIKSLAMAAAAEVFNTALVHFDIEKDLDIQIDVRDGRGPGQGSNRYRPKDRSELVSVSANFKSNDCNLCCGYAPLTELEQIVLAVEAYLTSVEYRRRYSSGTDVKIVGTRHGNSLSLLINIPLIAADVKNWEDYLTKLSSIETDVSIYLQTHQFSHVALTLNPEKEHGRPYMTVTGSVLDTGDIGVVGRGNRINGLITPMRPMSIEASSGKNPLDHTGKLYGIAAHRAARAIYEELALTVRVYFLSAKEKQLRAATHAHVEIMIHDSHTVSEVLPPARARIEQIVTNYLDDMQSLTQELITTGITQW
jgi:S-adenosylmethionine synthetase